jgi:carbon monoxide dehydrogenase subunit G
MGKIESRIGTLNASDEKVYRFISDFSNFTHMLPPDKVKNWQVNGDSCSFSIDGIGQLGLRIIEKEPFHLIKITSSEGTPFTFFLWIQLKNAADGETRVKITIDPDVNPMVMMMLNSPLQKFADAMIAQLEAYSF